MKTTKIIITTASVLMLTACGDTMGQRALSGGGIGAGAGALGAAVTGGSVGGGALVGGLVGAGVGAATNSRQIDLSK